MLKQVPPNNPGLLADNGAPLVRRIEEKTIPFLQGLEIDKDSLERFAEEMSSKGLSQATAYLYMQGHAVYDLVCRIGKSLFGFAFEHQILIPAFSCSADYIELNHIKSDVDYISHTSRQEY